MIALNHHGWPSTSRGARPVDEPEAELERLHEKLARLADGEASAAELWQVVERIRELRAEL